ncbi:hypothetical protein CKAH01_11793 [Colletotrichum kahawae]|uniref:Uncharacterized protein n=1 Tax=Colletotrichum kahawae TaxID=34407 RepID=A0AAD9YVB0_COLKA|nr:hypothetical protein CKAH01_11793 [Colletotrichum kahawae]
MNNSNPTPLTTVECQPTKEQVDDDVIYLGTYKVKDSHLTADPSQSKTGRNSRRPRDEITSNWSGRRKSHQKTTSSTSTPEIPAEMIYKHVKLGVMKDSSQLRRAVYGFFDHTGRLRHRIESRRHTTIADLDPCLKPALISHDRIEYRSCFRGLSLRQVRKELRRHIARKLYAHALDGEI